MSTRVIKGSRRLRIPKKKKYTTKQKADYAVKEIRKLKRDMDKDFAEISEIGQICYGSATAPNFFYILPNIAQGDAQGTRQGNSITQRKLDLIMTIVNNRGTPQDCYVRVMLILVGKLPQATTSTTAAQILLSAATGNDAFDSPRMIEGVSANLYKVLFNKRVYVSTNGVGGQSMKVLEYHRDLNNTMIFNDDLTGTDTDVVKGRLYMLVCSTSGADANCPSIDIVGRLKYTN